MSIFQSINFKIFSKGPLVVLDNILDFKIHNYICVLSAHGFSLALIDSNFNNALMHY